MSVQISTNIIVKQGAFRMSQITRNAKIMRQSANLTKRVLVRDAPVHSGKFRRTISVIDSTKRDAEGSYTGNFKVMPTSSKTKYIIKKTKRSPGMFIWRIKKRYKKSNLYKLGEHPGTKANNFITLAKPEIRAKIHELVRKEYGANALNLVQYIK